MINSQMVIHQVGEISCANTPAQLDEMIALAKVVDESFIKVTQYIVELTSVNSFEDETIEQLRTTTININHIITYWGIEPVGVIEAVAEITDPVDGVAGGNTISLVANDTLNGSPVVIGTSPGEVVLSGIDFPDELTLNADGTVTVAPGTPAGNYDITYQICEVSFPGNCDSTTSTVAVGEPVK